MYKYKYKYKYDNTFLYAEVKILPHCSGWSALRIEVTSFSPSTVLETAAVGVGFTMFGTVVYVANFTHSLYSFPRDISSNIFVRRGTGFGRS